MIFHELSEVRAAYDHVYLSPHLDDAALSCGGLIARQRAGHERVLVVTLCTAAPPPEGPFSDLALAFHAAWSLSPAEVVAARLQEDTAAMALLTVDALWAGCADAIYRHPTAYHSRDTLFGSPAPDDPLIPEVYQLVQGLRERLPAAAFYAPLGVGFHVDHQITSGAARAVVADGLALYEDFPYVARPGELERRLAAVDEALTPKTTPIAVSIERKNAAIATYASQLGELAASQLGRAVTGEAEATAVMAAAVADYATRVGGGVPVERLWLKATLPQTAMRG